MRDFIDTMPVLPHRFDAETVERLRQSAESAPLERIVRGECHADACRQGRMRCPTPQACHREIDDEPMPGEGAGVFVVPLGVVVLALLSAVVWAVMR